MVHAGRFDHRVNELLNVSGLGKVYPEKFIHFLFLDVVRQHISIKHISESS